MEERRPGHELVKEHPEREEIAAPVERAARELLGRHVRQLALHRAGARAGEPALGLRDAEVQDLHRALVGHEEVRGGDIPVDDLERSTLPVRKPVDVLEPVADLRDERGRDAGRDRAPKRLHTEKKLREVLPREPLEREVEDALHLAEVQDLHDVRMREPRAEPGLVEEHRREVVLAREVREHPLDDHELLEAARTGLPREEDLGHPAAGERP